jgi:hypothetical protein
MFALGLTGAPSARAVLPNRAGIETKCPASTAVAPCRNKSMPVAMRPISEGGGARCNFSLDIISAKVQIDSNRTSRKAFEFSILTLIGTPLSVPRGSFPASAGRTALAWEDIMVTTIEYRAMALQHHRWAGMCRSPESREEHFRLEKELLALADNEERTHGVPALERAGNSQQ